MLRYSPVICIHSLYCTMDGCKLLVNIVFVLNRKLPVSVRLGSVNQSIRSSELIGFYLNRFTHHWIPSMDLSRCSSHILQQFIPDRIIVNYNLRTKSHNKTLIPKNEWSEWAQLFNQKLVQRLLVTSRSLLIRFTVMFVFYICIFITFHMTCIRYRRPITPWLYVRISFYYFL